MSTVNVWVNGAWTLVDMKGPVGNQGPTGAAGTNQLTVNGMAWTQSITLADGNVQPTALTLAGSASADPCMTVVNGGQLKANKAGMYAISFSVWGGQATTDAGNWLQISRVVPDASGLTQLASADIQRGTDVGTAVGGFWLALNEVVAFIYGKNTGSSVNVQFDVRAVMIQ